MKPMHRRKFLVRTTAAGTLLGLGGLLPAVRGAEAPSNRVAVGVMGVSTRGSELAKGFASLPGVEVAYVCDVDERNASKTVELVAQGGKQERRARGVKDFRQI